MRRAWEKAEVSQKWAQSSWAKKIEAREKVSETLEIDEINDHSVFNHMFNPCLWIILEGQDDRLWSLQGHEGQENGKKNT